MSCCDEIDNGGVGGGGGGQPSASTVWEVDWAAESSQDFVAGGDGTYQLDDGTDFVVSNTGVATTFQITNGTGLQWDGCNGAVTHTANNAPSVGFDLADIIAAADFDTSRSWRLWWYMPALAMNNDDEGSIFCLRSPSAGGFIPQLHGAGPYRDGATDRAYVQNDVTRDITPAGFDPAPAAFDVYCVEWISEGTQQMFGGQWAGDWPELGDMTLFAFISLGATTASGWIRRPGTELFTAIFRLAAAGTNSMTVARQRVQIGGFD